MQIVVKNSTNFPIFFCIFLKILLDSVKSLIIYKSQFFSLISY